MEQPKTKYLVGTVRENVKVSKFVQPKLFDIRVSVHR